jgi:hypothetical protein
MSDGRSCVGCGNTVAESHIRAGYARLGAEGAICPVCVSRERRLERGAMAIDRSIDARRVAWTAAAFGSAASSFYFFHLGTFFHVGIGMFFLTVTTLLVFLKVLDVEIL